MFNHGVLFFGHAAQWLSYALVNLLHALSLIERLKASCTLMML
jgi:hypothetical protein